MSVESDRRCRSCGAPLSVPFADLGMQPIANAFRTRAQLSSPETFYPLRAYVCSQCKLVQLEDYGSREDHFNADYVYHSSVSSSWNKHARAYAAAMIELFGLDADSRVVEIASNDGYLLRHFVALGIPALGVEPSASVAERAREFGVETHEAFFGAETARRLVAEGFAADLMPANNVLAHVPDINDLLAGFRILLKPEGTATFEFPHLLALVQNVFFDTIYHEHYSYISLHALMPALERNGLAAFKVEKLTTHGRSLRVFVARADSGKAVDGSVPELLAEEVAAGLDGFAVYESFAERVRAIKREALRFLCDLKDRGGRIAAYGAPAKGNTFLNYTGVGTDFIDFVVDRNAAKQGRFLPGTGIPVVGVDALREKTPAYVIILPWNIADEVVAEHAYIGEWGGRFVTLMPTPRIL